MNMQTENVDPAELKKFDAMASRWWDPEGDFKPLHHINPVRLAYIDEHSQLAGKQTVDVGCGGGLLTEAMAACGANVTGIDMAESALAVAKLHLQLSDVGPIRYLQCSADQLAGEELGHFDVVTCMEVLEHVPDPAALVAACKRLARPGGKVFFSTINRNMKAYLFAILGAEYVLSLIPKGTHEYERFIKPSELRRWGLDCGMEFADLKGVAYSPFSGRSHLTTDTSVDYLMQFVVPE